MRKFFSLASLFIALIFSTACNKSKTIDLTILHTNDHHGRYWKDRKGRFGMSARMTLIEEIRKASNNPVMLLSGGDINTGTPESDLFDAEPDFKGMNLLKYDAMAVGNHEFDNPLPILLKQSKLANFPFLSANVYDKATGKRIFKPYIIKKIDGVKIAIIGLTTDDTPEVALDENIKGIDFKSPIEEAKKVISDLKKVEKPNFIFAVTHMGHYPEGNYGNKAPGDVTLAKEVKDLDLIIGGHTQKPLFQPVIVGKTLIVQAGEWGKYLGRVDLTLDAGEGIGVLKGAKLIPVNYKDQDGKPSEKVAEHPEMLKLLSPYYQQAQEKMTEVIGNADCKLDGDRKTVRAKLAPIGYLIAKAQKEIIKADFAVVNGGGIRDGLPKGSIKLQDVYKVHPFGNTVVSAELDYENLKKFIAGTLERLGSEDNGAFPHFYGITFKHKNKQPYDIKINGKPVGASKKYKVALNNFIAQGKEGYIDIRPMPSYVDSGFSDAFALESYIRENSVKCSDLAPEFQL